MLEYFLSQADVERALQTFRTLAQHDISTFALTGGLATELHCLQHGRQPQPRPLNDIDFIVDSFDCIPETLADRFLFWHIHPSDPPGKTLLQFVDPATALRIGVFRAHGAAMSRTAAVNCLGHALRLISLEDLAARAARLALDLAGGVLTPAKFAGDFLRLAELVNPAQVETAWQDQRKPDQPTTLREANDVLQSLIPARPDLLISPEYSQNPDAICPRCSSTADFALADPRTILSLLGYC